MCLMYKGLALAFAFSIRRDSSTSSQVSEPLEDFSGLITCIGPVEIFNALLAEPHTCFADRALLP